MKQYKDFVYLNLYLKLLIIICLLTSNRIVYLYELLIMA